MNKLLPSSSASLARAAATVTAAFLLSNLSGLVRQILVAQAFGTGAEIEAFNAANRVSETLFNLVAGGALASAFIPTFSGLLARDDQEKAWRLASTIANLVLLVLIFLSLATYLLAPEVVRYLLAPGFRSDPAKENLTIFLLRLMLPSAILFALSGLVMGILNSHQVFFIPALTPSMYHLGMIFGVLVLAPTLGIAGLGWGVLIGAGLHLGVQIPSLLRLRGKYFPGFAWGLPEVYEVVRLFAPRLIGVAVVQLNFWVNTRLASRMPEGSVTGVVLAFALMLMPQAAIAQSVAIVTLPTLSTHFALARTGELRVTLVNALRGVLFLAVPASVGLILLRKPIVATLYQRGAFDERSTEFVAWALLWYASGLVGHSLVEVLARSFYAMHDTRTPVLIGSIAMGLNVALSYLFSAIFQRVGWLPHGGLALANTLATYLEALGLYGMMRRKLGELREREIFLLALQTALASLLMAGGIQLWMKFLAGAPVALISLGGVLVGGGLFLSLALLFRIEEVRVLWGVILGQGLGSHQPHQLGNNDS
ncbi:MAG: murein biosynthesis integral membrane protein MurJ [Anaerolineales bacterium]|nr:murein biosynthesis integral membrane protein MurJ [Anaerolineales bacterium]MDW8160793.1 murein biosynthesis integral membrane protein MurJ [Anaerolineales bacterium]